MLEVKKTEKMAWKLVDLFIFHEAMQMEGLENLWRQAEVKDVGGGE